MSINGLDNIPIYNNPDNSDYEQVLKNNRRSFDSAYDFIKNVYTNNVAAEQETSSMKQAPYSLANRLALYTWMGLHGSNLDDLTKYYKDQINKNIG